MKKVGSKNADEQQQDRSAAIRRAMEETAGAARGDIFRFGEAAFANSDVTLLAREQIASLASLSDRHFGVGRAESMFRAGDGLIAALSPRPEVPAAADGRHLSFSQRFLAEASGVALPADPKSGRMAQMTQALFTGVVVPGADRLLGAPAQGASPSAFSGASEDQPPAKEGKAALPQTGVKPGQVVKQVKELSQVVTWVVRRETLEGAMTVSHYLAQGIRGGHVAIQTTWKVVRTVDAAFDSVLELFDPMGIWLQKKMGSVVSGAAFKAAQGVVMLGNAATPDVVKRAYREGKHQIHTLEATSADWFESSYGIPSHKTSCFYRDVGVVARETIVFSIAGGAVKLMERAQVSNQIAGSCRHLSKESSPKYYVRPSEDRWTQIIDELVSKSSASRYSDALERLEEAVIDLHFPKTDWIVSLTRKGIDIGNARYVPLKKKIIRVTNSAADLIVKVEDFSTIMGEWRAMAFFEELQLKHLTIPPRIIFSSIFPQAVMVKSFIRGKTFRQSVEQIVSSDRVLRRDLIRDFTGTMQQTGVGIGELHYKSLSGFPIRGEEASSIISEITSDISDTNLLLSEIGIGQLRFHPHFDTLLRRFLASPGPASFAIRDVSFDQFVRTPSGAIAPIDIECGAASFSPAGNQVGSAYYDYNAFLKMIQSEGLRRGLELAEIRELKNSFSKGYLSQFKDGISSDAALLLDIDLHVDSLKLLAEDMLEPDLGQTLHPEIISRFLEETNRKIRGQ